jgi:hypothetical protein
MYFGKQETQNLFDQIRSLMCERARPWFDQVSSDAVSDKTDIPEVQAFMDHMIGEPFIRGFANVVEEVRDIGFYVDDFQTAYQSLARSEVIFNHYSFAVCRRETGRSTSSSGQDAD